MLIQFDILAQVRRSNHSQCLAISQKRCKISFLLWATPIQDLFKHKSYECETSFILLWTCCRFVEQFAAIDSQF